MLILESAQKSPSSRRAVGEVETGRAGVFDGFRGRSEGGDRLAAPVYAGHSRFLDVVPAEVARGLPDFT